MHTIVVAIVNLSDTYPYYFTMITFVVVLSYQILMELMYVDMS